MPDPFPLAPNSTGSTISVWMATSGVPDLERQARNLEVDVCVVGAGIAGLTTAYLLAREGKSVVVLDSGPVGGGETGRTTAHLTAAIDDRYYELEKLHGESKSRLAADSHTRAIETISEIVLRENIHCQLDRVDGYLFLKPNDDVELLRKELAAIHRAGLRDVVECADGPDSQFPIGPCLKFPMQGQFHVLKYLNGLAEALQRAGATILTGARVNAFKSDGRVTV